MEHFCLISKTLKRFKISLMTSPSLYRVKKMFSVNLPKSLFITKDSGTNDLKLLTKSS